MGKMVVLCTEEQLEQFKNDPNWKELPDPFKKLYGEITQADMQRFSAVMERMRTLLGVKNLERM